MHLLLHKPISTKNHPKYIQKYKKERYTTCKQVKQDSKGVDITCPTLKSVQGWGIVFPVGVPSKFTINLYLHLLPPCRLSSLFKHTRTHKTTVRGKQCFLIHTKKVRTKSWEKEQKQRVILEKTPLNTWNFRRRRSLHHSHRHFAISLTRSSWRNLLIIHKSQSVETLEHIFRPIS